MTLQSNFLISYYVNFTLLFIISFVLLLFLRTGRCKTEDPDLRDRHVSDEKQLLEHIAELQHDKMFPVLEAFGDIAKRSSCVAHAVRLKQQAENRHAGLPNLSSTVSVMKGLKQA